MSSDSHALPQAPAKMSAAQKKVVKKNKKPKQAVTQLNCADTLTVAADPPEPLDMNDDVPGLTLGNTHEVFSGKGRLLRGHEPGANARQLTDIGVTDVLIFKVDVRGEVAKEESLLESLGVTEDHIHHIPMPWQGIKKIEGECRKTIEAANILLGIAATKGRTGYFHCSAGQDRTGLLSGVLRMALKGWSPTDAFFKEMCAHGYGFGDTKRPLNVSGLVEKNLTPIFLQIASQLADHPVASNQLDPELCAEKPASPIDPAPFVCR